MNVLPRINFLSSMLPLTPPTGYWQKLDSSLRRYVWNGKLPNIKLSTLQFNKKAGGLACPNFKLHHWAFILKSLSYWLEDNKTSAWKNIEQKLIAPIRLQDFLLIGMSSKICGLYYGPILSHVLQVFKVAEKFLRF